MRDGNQCVGSWVIEVVGKREVREKWRKKGKSRRGMSYKDEKKIRKMKMKIHRGEQNGKKKGEGNK